MNRDQALKILELNDDASDDDVKKAFRKLAAKYHPDVNKDSDAEDKFKQINAAHKTLLEPEPQPVFNHPGVSYQHWNMNVNPPRRFHNRGHIQIPIPFTFAESVLGCKKSFQVSKYISCDDCQGTGVKLQAAGVCPTCKGARRKVTQRGFVTMVQECGDCSGTGSKVENCEVCKGETAFLKESTMTVSVDGGLVPGKMIRLRGGGHYQNDALFGPSATDLFITPQITLLPNMKLSGINVISTLELDLLEAVQGCKKKVQTIKDHEVEMTVPKKSRNKDEIVIKGGGVPPHGNHVYVLDVKYPEPISEFIRKLKGD